MVKCPAINLSGFIEPTLVHVSKGMKFHKCPTASDTMISYPSCPFVMVKLFKMEPGPGNDISVLWTISVTNENVSAIQVKFSVNSSVIIDASDVNLTQAMTISDDISLDPEERTRALVNISSNLVYSRHPSSSKFEQICIHDIQCSMDPNPESIQNITSWFAPPVTPFLYGSDVKMTCGNAGEFAMLSNSTHRVSELAYKCEWSGQWNTSVLQDNRCRS